MPPVKLGVILLTPFLVARLVRSYLERRLVLALPVVDQGNRQFLLDFLLCVIIGAVVMVFNLAAHGFPLLSGVKVIIGCTVAGFFISLDMMLNRERSVLQGALDQSEDPGLPRRLYSLTRRFALVAITTTLFVTVIIGLVISSDISWIGQIEQNEMVASRALRSVMVEVFFIIGVLLVMVMNLIVSYSKNLKFLFENETGVLARVSQGDLTNKVPVVTGDEFGVIAGHTNMMIDGLRHRGELVSSLKLAEEVQQNLLPRHPPSHPGVEASGASIYCDETGGDYYDYFTLTGNRLGVLVADVSDHGISAALLMASVRAHVHSNVRNYSRPRQLVEQVNRSLAMETEDTGRFVTLFFLEVDTASRTLCWVRAGHDPAILYDPLAGEFIGLAGKGLALGVDDATEFQEYSRRGWSPGSVLVVRTDGIHESRNSDNDVFGVDRLQAAIAGNAAEAPETIQRKIIEELDAFRGDAAQEDDITLVVLKLL